MFRARIIPCLLLKNEGLVKTVKFKKCVYVGDPINAVKVFNQKEVDELIFLDISATPEKKEPPIELLSKIASECFMPFAYGGGLRSLETIRHIFRLGVEKAVINTYAFENPSFVSQASQEFGSQSIIVSLDVKRNVFGKYEVFTHAGKRNTRKDPVESACLMEEMGAGEIFLNSIDRDGMQQGYDLELVKRVAQSVKIPVVACGGAGSIQDLKDVVTLGGASAAAAGSLFVFTGPHRAVLINYQVPQDTASATF